MNEKKEFSATIQGSIGGGAQARINRIQKAIEMLKEGKKEIL